MSEPGKPIVQPGKPIVHVLVTEATAKPAETLEDCDFCHYGG